MGRVPAMLAAIVLAGACSGTRGATPAVGVTAANGSAANGSSAPVAHADPAADTGFNLRVTPITTWKLDGVPRTDRPPVRVRGVAPGRHKIAIGGVVGFIGQEITITVVAGNVVDIDAVLDTQGATSSKLATSVVGGGGHMVVTDTDIEILDIVRFQPGTAVLAGSAEPILDAVAATLQGSPSILLVEVQSHTTEPSSDAQNLQLSQLRADAVRTRLIAKGVAPARLVAQGYGTTQPLDRSLTAAARAKNDRIAFLILKRQP